mgnify:CR=1 FL=1
MTVRKNYSRRDTAMGEHVFRSECELRHEAINDRLDGVEQTIRTGFNDLNQRLFRDNGHQSIQSKINDHDRTLRGIVWVGSIIGSSVLVALVAGAIAALRWLISAGAI